MNIKKLLFNYNKNAIFIIKKNMISNSSDYFSSNIIIFEHFIIEKETYPHLLSPIISAHKSDISFINFFDNYQTYNAFMKREITHFPVIRIFGTTIIGQKCCINIHNYYPYFYIEITEDNYFNYQNSECLYKFANLVEKSYLKIQTEKEKENPQNFQKNEKKPKCTQIIHKILIEQKTNLYGYYKNKSIFLKIECYNPKDIKGLMDIFQGGVIMGKFYQCFEAHISHSIHFFSQYGLCGMGEIKIKKYSFRYPLKEQVDVDFSNVFCEYEDNFIWTKEESDSNIPSKTNYRVWDMRYKEQYTFNLFAKGSKSEIEIDCLCEDILSENEHDYDVDNGNEHVDSRFQKEITLSNLRHHIQHTSSLIDLWKDEIERRAHSDKNLPSLTFEPISDQGVFELNENFILTHSDISSTLLRLNFFIDKENLDNNNQQNKNNNDIYVLESNIERLIKGSNKNIYKEQYGNSYAWYKKHYSITLFENGDKEEGEEDDFINQLNCFQPRRSLNEQSFSLSSRKRIKDIMTTKTIDECLYEGGEDEGIAKNYSLLKANRKFFVDSNNKNVLHLKEMKNDFFTVFGSKIHFYLKDEVFDVCYDTICNKMKNDHYFFDVTINKNLNNLYYSEVNDYNLFYRKDFQVNEKRKNNNYSLTLRNHSLKMFIEQHNKIIKFISSPISDSIENRRKRIFSLISKAKIINDANYSTIDEQCQLYVIEHQKKIFKWEKPISYKDIESKINNIKLYKKKKEQYNNQFYQKFFDNNNSSLLSTQIEKLSLYNNIYMMFTINLNKLILIN